MSIYFTDYSINKVSKNILGNENYAYLWGTFHKRNSPIWLNVNLIIRK